MNLRIRALREENDLYQRNLAEYLGCTQQTYSRYETGELQPSLTILENLARFYDTSTDYIMGLSDEPASNWNKESRDGISAKEASEKRRKIISEPKTKRGRKPKLKTEE